MYYFLNTELKALIKKIAVCIEQDTTANDNELLNELLAAYNTYQEQERDSVDYIFNVNNPQDIICCVKGGLSRNELQNLLNECSEKNCDLFLFGVNHPTAELMTNVRSQIKGHALEIATFIMYNPQCYQKLYDRYVADPMSSECGARYCGLQEFAYD